jgi:hypothetical protein
LFWSRSATAELQKPEANWCNYAPFGDHFARLHPTAAKIFRLPCDAKGLLDRATIFGAATWNELARVARYRPQAVVVNMTRKRRFRVDSQRLGFGVPRRAGRNLFAKLKVKGPAAGAGGNFGGCLPIFSRLECLTWTCPRGGKTTVLVFGGKRAAV